MLTQSAKSPGDRSWNTCGLDLLKGYLLYWVGHFKGNSCEEEEENTMYLYIETVPQTTDTVFSHPSIHPLTHPPIHSSTYFSLYRGTLLALITYPHFMSISLCVR